MQLDPCETWSSEWATTAAVESRRTTVTFTKTARTVAVTVAVNDLLLADEVAGARVNGRTWTQFAAVLGITKQAARERFSESAQHAGALPPAPG